MAPHFPIARSRREFITESFCGFGAVALGALMQQELGAASVVNPLAPKAPHMPDKARAKAVIFLFLAGGPSHMDSFDPKPLLNRLHGQKRPESFGQLKYESIKADEALLLGSKRTFSRHGNNGIEVSDAFPHLAGCIDDLAVIRSCYCDSVSHAVAQYQLFSGRLPPGFPSFGSWVLYGLGSVSDSLPGYVVMPDPNGVLPGGNPMYRNGFLPAVYQPTIFRPGKRPVLNLDLPAGVSMEQQRQTIDLIRGLNQAYREKEDSEFSARISTYELAFKMQMDAPEIFDLSNEKPQTLEMYGIGAEKTDDYGRRCLLARRLVEKGVRVVIPVSGGGSGNNQWDGHNDADENLTRMAGKTDQPMAALIKDLKRTGLWESTLVLIGGEFGRTPESQGSKGRDHHPYGFTYLLGGSGIKGGQVVGATDELGFRVIEKPYHFRDLHTTVLYQLGLNQDALNYLYQGRKERLTQIQGKLISEII
jgi:uncharacterized protein DUF1501